MAAGHRAPEPGKTTLLYLRAALLLIAVVAAALLLWLPEDFRHFNERAIGIGILEGVDASFRNNLYVLAVIAGLALCSALGLFVPPGERKVQPDAYRLETLLGLCAGANVLMALLGEFPWLFWRTAILCLGFAGVLLALSRMRPGLNDRHKVLMIASAWQMGVLAGLASGAVLGPVWLGGLMLLLMVVVALCLPPTEQVLPLSQRSLGIVLALLLFAPLAFLLTNELGYILDMRGLPLPRGLLFSLLLLLLAVGFMRREEPLPGVTFAALSVLITTVAFNEYNSFIHYRGYDLFHQGEAMVPLQQWDSFARLPFVDFLPVHGLFDLLPQGLYFWLSGAEVLESPVWGSGYFFGWLMRGAAIVLVFMLFTGLLGPMAAFVLIWLLPTYHLVEPYYVLLLLPALHLLALRDGANSGLGWWLRQWLITGLVALWRPDFGLAAAAANSALAIIMAWELARWRSLRTPLLGALFVFGPALALYLALVGPGAGIDNLATVYSYLGNQIAVVSYTRMYESFDYAAALQYLVLPGLTVILAAFSVSRLALRSGSPADRRLDLLIVFLGALTLVMAMRSLHRHSLLEGMLKPYFFLLLPMVFAWRYSPPRWALPAVMAVIVGGFLLLPAPTSDLMRAGHRYDPPWEYPQLEPAASMPAWEGEEAVRLVNQVLQYDAFLAVMDEALEPRQTFFEFTNGPLLYALADVPLPVFIMETVYLSTDTIQARTIQELEAWRSAGRLPYVVMRQNLPVADSLDGVDNALRAYRVAEYLYAHYQPCFRVSGLDVWVQRSGATACRPRDLGQALPPRQRPRALKPLSFEQALYFGLLPYYWALLDEVEETLDPAESFRGLSETARRRQALKPGRAENPCFERACYLDLDIQSERQQNLVFGGGNGIAGSLQLKPGRHQYRLRLSTLWHVFRARRWPALSLEGEARFTLHAAVLQPLSGR